MHKIKADIIDMKKYCTTQFNIYDKRLNNAFRKISNLEKNNTNKKNEDPISETRIIKIGGNNSSSMPPLFPILSMFGGINKDKDKEPETNELIDSEDEYNENVDVYEYESNEDMDIMTDIIEVEMEINTIDDLINIGLKYKNIFDDINIVKKSDKNDNSSDEMLSTDKIVNDICKKVFSDMFKTNKIYDPEEIEKPTKKKKINNNDNIEDNKKDNKEKNYYEYSGKKYAIDIKKIVNLIEPLNKLKRIIGMEKIKKQILDMILYYIQGFEKKNSDMLHTSIEGPPGVGKTKLGRILAHIYSALEIIPSKRFKRVRRTDLIGKYLGHTAHKTQEIIDEAEGGVLFIDEAYSLGDNENRDSFSKECIDTINQNLTEKKKKLIVIVAGYQDQLDKTFFAVNEGLRRRFPFRFQIDGYNEKELSEIFISKIKKIKWKLNKNITEEFLNQFFKTNKNNFKHFGGDIETLVMNCKMTYSSRVIGKKNAYKKILIKEDLESAYKTFIENKKKSDELPDNVKTFYS
jgi:hypothetical protein